jgi:hypothetical protein
MTTRYAVYVRGPREATWGLRDTFETQAEAEALAARLVAGPPDLEYGDQPGRVDETLVEALPAAGEVPRQLPADQVAPVVSRFVRAGLAG